MPAIRTCLGFDDRAEEAVEFYTSVFPSSRVLSTVRYGAAGPMAEGTLMVATFELDGVPLMALNGGPSFTFSYGMSLEVTCETQEEVDHYWERLSEGGEQGPCGWLRDRFGVSWQVVPRVLAELVGGDDRERADRVMTAMLGMGKIEIEGLLQAAEREAAA